MEILRVYLIKEKLIILLLIYLLLIIEEVKLNLKLFKKLY